MRPTDLFIDLGTANTLIYGKGKGLLLNEPSVFAIKNNRFDSSEFGSGDQAKTMAGKTPENVTLLKPLQGGVIADFSTTQKMLQSFLSQIKINKMWTRPRMIMSLPCRVTGHERQAVIDIGMKMGARHVLLIDEPLAAAIGCGLDIFKHEAHMVVDMGGGTTEIAIIASGGIVESQAIRIGGDAITERIAHDLRQQFNFIVGDQTAEAIKHSVANIDINESTLSHTVKIGGFDLERGLPRKFEVSNLMIQDAVESVIERVTFKIKETLASLDPEVVVDIIDKGILLTGGGALISGLDKYFTHHLGVETFVCADPLLAVTRGGSTTLEDLDIYNSIQLPVSSG